MPTHAVFFVNAYVQCKLFSKLSFETSLKKALDTALYLGKHSQIYHFGTEDPLLVRVEDKNLPKDQHPPPLRWFNFRLVYTNNSRPWGVTLPITCLICHRFQAYEPKRIPNDSDLKVNCEFSCGSTLSIPRLPKDAHPFVKERDALWYVQERNAWAPLDYIHSP